MNDNQLLNHEDADELPLNYVLRWIYSIATNRNGAADSYIEEGGLRRRASRTRSRTGKIPNVNEEQYIRWWLRAWIKWSGGCRKGNRHYPFPPLNAPTMARLMGRTYDEVCEWIFELEEWRHLLRSMSTPELADFMGRSEDEIEQQWDRLNRLN